MKGIAIAFGIVLLLVIVVIGISPKSAAPATVNIGLTLPLLRADSTNCQLAAPGDTLKNLASLAVYASSSASLTDSTLVYSANVGGLYGRPYTFNVSQPTWTTRWYFCVTRDSLNLRACRSNVISRTVTAGPPGRVVDLRAP